MKFTVNGEPIEAEAKTVGALLKERGIDRSKRGIAIAVNGMVSPRDRWDETILAEGDRIEIVRPFSGG